MKTAEAGILGPARRLHMDRAGQLTVEWAMVMAAFCLPMYWVVKTLLAVLVGHFQMVTFIDTTPFP